MNTETDFLYYSQPDPLVPTEVFSPDEKARLAAREETTRRAAAAAINNSPSESPAA